MRTARLETAVRALRRELESREGAVA
jgi:hypothetical protein